MNAGTMAYHATPADDPGAPGYDPPDADSLGSPVYGAVPAAYDDTTVYAAPPEDYLENQMYAAPPAVDPNSPVYGMETAGYEDTQVYDDGTYDPYKQLPGMGQNGSSVPEDTIADVPLEEPEEAPPEPRSIFKPALRKPNFILSVSVNVVRIMVLLVVLGGLAALGAIAGIAKGYVETAPELDLTALDRQAQTSFLYDRSWNQIAEYKGTENRVMVNLGAMPKYLQDAFVSVEDARFYTHNGVDIKRIVGAFLANLTSSSTQGGSTITQQLIKNTVLSSEISYKRKIQEAYLALELEQKYSKEQILESYLNTIYLGENYYGVQVASEGYFGKSLGELTLRECAMLAGINKSPYYYNPRRNFYIRAKDGVDYAKITNDRTNYVLRTMMENQFITKEQYDAALDPATANVLKVSPLEVDGLYPYPHYVEYAVQEVVQILLELNQLENTAANRDAMESKLRTGGYRVQLAIDTAAQTTLENTLESWGKYPALKDPSDKVYRSKNPDGTYTEIIQPQAAAVVLDYRTGEIKAMVGGRTKPTSKKTLNRATDMRMPVGSSIKPISVYAPALELGASPASIVYNMPVPIPGWRGKDGKDSWPKNYGGGGYVGPETLRTAMEKSHNTAAAQTLLTLVGVERSVDFLHRMGVDDKHIDATPFGLALGSSGITPLQMAVAYGVLANGGVYQEPLSVLGISDNDGNVVWDGHGTREVNGVKVENQERRRVFSASTSYMIVDMLQGAVRNGTGTGAKIKGQTVAGKTGTNSDQKGVFFAGMTGYYTSALWIGHDNYKALSGKTTGSGAAVPLWQNYMMQLHEGLPNRAILDGDPSQYDLVKATTCAVSGQLATEACYNDASGRGVITDWWAKGTVPQVPCQMHAAQSVCAETGQIATPYCPNPLTKGVVVIPPGHPLYHLIGTEYDGVLSDYLGPWATVRFGPDGSVISGGTTCQLHGSGTAVPGGQDPLVTNTLIPDAQLLIEQANAQLQSTDPASPTYGNISAAIQNLRNIISSNGSQADIAAAMGQLTMAMAGL